MTIHDKDIDVDIQKVEQTSVSQEDPQMEMMAHLAAQVLSKHYKAHLWAVGWAPGGALIIKNMATDCRYGYSVDVPACATISEFEHEVMLGGGEILERMGMDRHRAWNGEFANHLEIGR